MNKKAVSSLTLIILMLVSVVIGGIIAYMLTIAYYVEIEYNIPENKIILTITDVYIDPEHASSFTITVLNPSFSISNATITKIAVNVADKAELYEAVETNPIIGDGLTVLKGKAVNITCLAIQMGGKRVPWGEFAYEFAAQPITIHVFSQEASAANKKVTLPYVKLHVNPTFLPENTFERFEVTLVNDENSETNLTIQEISLVESKVDYTVRQMPLETVPKNITPRLPYSLCLGENQTFTCKLNWLGINETKIAITTEEGYKIFQKTEPKQTYFTIENVIFNENDTEHFNVTVKNHLGSAGKVTLTNITYSLDNGTTRCVENITPTLPVDITPMLNLTFTCTWNWHEYRGRNITITVYLKQGFNRSVAIIAPKSVILKVLSRDETFDLKDTKHFNLTLFNHQSSLEPLNITKIEVEHIILKGNLTNPELPYAYLNPGEALSINCTYSWKKDAGENLTLIVYTVTNKTNKEYQFAFTFTLPKAELNITSVQYVESELVNYLNITVENMPYSVWNLTISKIIVSFENETKIFEKQWSSGLIVLAPNESYTVRFEIGYEKFENVNITVKVLTEEGVECTWSGIPST